MTQVSFSLLFLVFLCQGGTLVAEKVTNHSSHWAFEKLKKPQVPKVMNRAWPFNEIDNFVLRKLEEKKMVDLKDASVSTMIRRLYFDLIGLPPTTSQLKHQLSRVAKHGYEPLINELLSSPLFGQKWARHWLDVARYGESSGKEFNFTYPYAWRYRDYVIDAFNKDKSYKTFIKEQLAGDLLSAKTEAQRVEQLTATGFLVIGPKSLNNSKINFKHEVIDEQIKVVSEAFLGLTVACAKCHDHKYDPISARDYYALSGIFESTELNLGLEKRKFVKVPSYGIPIGGKSMALHQKYKKYCDEVEQLNQKLEKEKNKLKDKKNDQALKQLIADLEKKLKDLKLKPPEKPSYVMGVSDKAKPVNSFFAHGGDYNKKGDQIERGFVKAFHIKGVSQVNQKKSGRLELAEWIAHEQNPLAARVMVNRIWKQLMGQGLVGSVDNFGTLGNKPTHLNLLNFLSQRFIENNWSVKKLIHMIVSSRAYQLSTKPNERYLKLDADNQFRWRMTPRRLDVEQMRDAMLFVSDSLTFGAYRGSRVQEAGQKLVRDLKLQTIYEDFTFRSVYLPILRNNEPGILREFDFPSSSLVNGKRDITTGPKQALYLMNHPWVLKVSRGMALKISGMNLSLKQQVEELYLRCYSRPVSQTELKHALDFLKKMQTSLQSLPQKPSEPAQLALTSLIQTLFCSVEFRYLTDAL